MTGCRPLTIVSVSLVRMQQKLFAAQKRRRAALGRPSFRILLTS